MRFSLQPAFFSGSAHAAKGIGKTMKASAKLLSYLLVAVLVAGSAAGRASAEENTVRIAYAKWSCATAASHVVKAVLTEKMGYDCRLAPMGAEALWLSTASGDMDGFVCAWLPSLHQHFYAKTEYNVVDLGPNMEGTRVGLVVPDYVFVDSIAGLEANAEKFENRIVGIDPGAGIMRMTRQAMKAYGISNMELAAGSGAAMTEILAEKIKKHEWVVVTGWTPHWKFAKWELRYLEDPKKIYGAAEAIHTVVRKDLKQDLPRVYRFLDNFRWTPGDIHQVMAMIHESGAPYESAVKWVQAHPDKVAGWVGE